jgi:hypothetical protein
MDRRRHPDMDRSRRPAAAIPGSVWNDLSRNCKRDRPVDLSCPSRSQKSSGFRRNRCWSGGACRAGAEEVKTAKVIKAQTRCIGAWMILDILTVLFFVSGFCSNFEDDFGEASRRSSWALPLPVLPSSPEFTEVREKALNAAAPEIGAKCGSCVILSIQRGDVPAT